MNIQWILRDYSNRITDPAPLAELGGSTKIDSIQNVILLRGDLHAAWYSYKFAVNPDVYICHLSKVPVLIMSAHSSSMLLFPSFPAAMISLEISSSSITLLTPIFDLLMSFCATIFFNAY